MRIQGQLDGDILVNLLQYLNLNGASGVLRLTTGLGSSGEVFTENGQVVHASTGESRGMTALVRLLRFTQGRFRFEAGVEAPERSIDKPLDALLLEVAYATDVADQDGERLLGSTVLNPRSSSADRQAVTLPVLALKLLPLLGRGTDLAGIAASTGAPLDEVLAAAQVIVNAGLASPHRSANVAPEFIHSLIALTRDIIGPLADIVVDEALYDLNLTADSVPEDQLPELLQRLGALVGQERADGRASFDRRAAELLRRVSRQGSR